MYVSWRVGSRVLAEGLAFVAITAISFGPFLGINDLNGLSWDERVHR